MYLIKYNLLPGVSYYTFRVKNIYLKLYLISYSTKRIEFEGRVYFGIDLFFTKLSEDGNILDSLTVKIDTPIEGIYKFMLLGYPHPSKNCISFVIHREF